MKKLLPAIFALTFAWNAQARLGESPSQVSARYGAMKGAPEIVGTNVWKGKFRHGGYDITVTFWNAKAVEEEFFSDANTISESDAHTIFQAVSGDGKVTARSGNTGDAKLRTVYFDNLNNGATGLLFNDGIGSGSLDVTSKDYVDFRSKKSNEDTKRKLAEF